MNDFWDASAYDGAHAFVSRLGAGVVELLDPKQDEEILDLGCGTGQLTAQIAASGAVVTGLDASAKMLDAARAHFPDGAWRQGDARDFELNRCFDAVFSNAVLHWILEPERVAQSVFRHLKSGGRFVGEFGARGNVEILHGALEAAARQRGLPPFERNKYFPTIGDWAGVLENAGFEVRLALVFERPTPLEGAEGAKNWLLQFCAYYLDDLSADEREAVVAEAQQRARSQLWQNGRWHADYRRLRFVAVRPE